MTRRIGIPGDWKVEEGVFAFSSTLPPLWGLEAMGIREVHKLGITGKGVKIGVSDTGYRPHPFLPNPVATKNFTSSKVGVQDVAGHGTHCAGIAIGRVDDNGNSLGVAPEADLFVAKVLGDNGSGSTTGINAGRIWLSKQGVDIVSESLGDNGGPDVPEDIEAYNEVYGNGVSVCVAALGNAGFNGSNTVGRPGSYKQTIGVAALKEDLTIAGFSSGGPAADVATPGQNILSCGLNNNIVSMSGTSMATPFLAGLCALIIHKRRMSGYADMKGWMEWRKFFSDPRFVDDVGSPGKDNRYGYGIPSIAKIIKYLLTTEWV